MNVKGSAYLTRTAQLSLIAALVLPFLGGIGDGLTTHGDVCAEYHKNGLLFVDAPNLGIVGCWLGAISSLVSLVSAAMWLISKLRNPGPITRWTYGGWFFFLSFPAVSLFLNILGLWGSYPDAIGYIVECI
ncbi:MAG TPA: hypothetical protein VF444_17165 [Pseudonocardiaceae bacterium]